MGPTRILLADQRDLVARRWQKGLSQKSHHAHTHKLLHFHVAVFSILLIDVFWYQREERLDSYQVDTIVSRGIFAVPVQKLEVKELSIPRACLDQ